jgi:phage tail sheath protein FI
MPSYLSPGVYVEEIDSGTRPIEAVGTSTAGFVGTAPNPDAFVDEAIAINNWSEFRRRYVRDGDKGTDLANAVYGFFLNGGSRCYVVNTKADGAIAGKGRGSTPWRPSTRSPSSPPRAAPIRPRTAPCWTRRSR